MMEFGHDDLELGGIPEGAGNMEESIYSH